MPSLIVKTPPAVEPISLAEAKAHLRVDMTDDDATIQHLIRSARHALETRYDRAIITQSLVLGRDYFPSFYGLGYTWTPGGWFGQYWMTQYTTQELNWGYIALRPPVQSITSVTYIDTSGNSQIWPSTNYGLDGDSEPGRLYLLPGKTFPTTAQQLATVKIEFVSGNTSPDLVPADIREAVKLLMAHYYENREETVTGSRLVSLQLPYGVQQLMTNYDPSLVA